MPQNAKSSRGVRNVMVLLMRGDEALRLLAKRLFFFCFQIFEAWVPALLLLITRTGEASRTVFKKQKPGKVNCLREESMSKSKTGSTKDPTAKRANTLRKVKYLHTSCVCVRACVCMQQRESV